MIKEKRKAKVSRATTQQSVLEREEHDANLKDTIHGLIDLIEK